MSEYEGETINPEDDGQTEQRAFSAAEAAIQSILRRMLDRMVAAGKARADISLVIDPSGDSGFVIKADPYPANSIVVHGGVTAVDKAIDEIVAKVPWTMEQIAATIFGMEAVR